MMTVRDRWQLMKVRRWEAGKEVPSWSELENIGEVTGQKPERLAEMGREEYERAFPTAKSRGVPWWRR